jgi:hypothetical protein
MDTYRITLTRDFEIELQELPLRVLVEYHAVLGRSRAKAVVADLLRAGEVVIHGFSAEEASQIVEKIRPLGARCSIERDLCPVCGSPLTRVLSDWRVVLSAQQRALAVSGRAILGPDDRNATPDSVCLACVPEWREFHRLALQDYDWQIEKEHAVADSDFDRARSIRDQQAEPRRRLQALLERLRA